MVIWVFSKTHPVVMKPHTQPDLLLHSPTPLAPQEHVVHLRARLCPQDARRQIHPSRPSEEGAEAMDGCPLQGKPSHCCPWRGEQESEEGGWGI